MHRSKRATPLWTLGALMVSAMFVVGACGSASTPAPSICKMRRRE